MMRLIRPFAVALVGVGMALTLSAGTAVAAKGPFTFQSGGRPFYVEDVPDGKCFTMSQPATAPHNGTGSVAIVFAGKKCTGKATRIAPGKQAPKGLRFASVRFGR
ncbi:hypothetical protein A8W25_16005 [Streptomyces sp. ERV7]|uniref:hypothetical protein n=1 Tax=Streptomyces sp. ERV7 TaxID=1322334 RepID=UPI0007F40B53|nr:hypothetical protein [Streptomyces sp. ERV7]OAR23974.1 hypothetical protein A8W25_16005 [Streptomyces sp. ERV7]